MPTRSRPRRKPTQSKPGKEQMPSAGARFERLVEIMAILRSPNGCPWDLKQSHQTLRGYLIEETYEAVDAIDRGDLAALRGELGDVLLQCVFHAQLASEKREFTISDVVETLTKKLIARHPHIFSADGKRLSARAPARQHASTSGAVLEQWAKIKAAEQAATGATPRILAGVPRALPALLRAHKISSRVSSIGFDWKTEGEVLDKVAEEFNELKEAVHEGRARFAEELGDLLFALASLARKAGFDAEQVLSAANDKFTSRFDQVEALLSRRGRDVHDATLGEMEDAWQAVKALERRRQKPRAKRPSTSSRVRAGRPSQSSRPRRGRS